MCMICDGATPADVLTFIDHHVRRRGWALQGVEATPATDGWTYTVGLSTAFTHPELVVLGEVDRFASLLNELSERIALGAHLVAGDIVETSVCLVQIGPVHPSHISQGLLAMAQNYRTFVGPDDPPLRALEVIVPRTPPHLVPTPAYAESRLSTPRHRSWNRR